MGKEWSNEKKDLKIRKLIRNCIESVLEKYGFKAQKIILFGSRARGDHREDSDWDILVVVENRLSRREKTLLFTEIVKALAEEFIPCDVLIKTCKEVEKLKTWVHSATKDALKEGIVL